MVAIKPTDDRVVMRQPSGRTHTVPWCGETFGIEAQTIIVNRMPLTFEERTWFWTTLPSLLVPGGSIRFRKDKR